MSILFYDALHKDRGVSGAGSEVHLLFLWVSLCYTNTMWSTYICIQYICTMYALYFLRHAFHKITPSLKTLSCLKITDRNTALLTSNVI